MTKWFDDSNVAVIKGFSDSMDNELTGSWDSADKHLTGSWGASFPWEVRLTRSCIKGQKTHTTLTHMDSGSHGVVGSEENSAAQTDHVSDVNRPPEHNLVYLQDRQAAAKKIRNIGIKFGNIWIEFILCRCVLCRCMYAVWMYTV